ncbi:MAG: 16S rRNA (cytidine(1402)-2'-O)-methyltransferase [Verrucomicrobiales bacterium]|nr:16S rRNA (cytidine(1402)-2'-O)-methyltransferase [Verrucomicrobiales bacterium]
MLDESQHEKPGRIVFIATPIGNLGDITLRSIEALKEADWIACEDTRRSSKLLHRLEIKKPLMSFHEHNERQRGQHLLDEVLAGKVIACLTDAGMPGISDPGYRLVQACLEQEVPFEILPGPSAVLMALLGSGLPTDSFYFGGFLPHKKGKRLSELEAATERSCTSVYFESPHRIVVSLEMIKGLAQEHPVCVARELTKKFESWYRGSVSSVIEQLGSGKVKGEITLMVAGKTKVKKQRREQREPQ